MRAIQSSFLIPYTSRDFPPGIVAGQGYLKADWCDLLWAALTVGRPNTAYVFGHGDASHYEALFRLSLVRMALEERPLSPWLYRTEAFRSLDPTEKGAVSYFLGMTVCKLFTEMFLDTTWLLHLDVFRDQLDPVLLGGRSRPDLLGEDSIGAWHAFECKGRSSVPNAEERRKAKLQAERLVRVGATNCSLHVGAISYFRQDRLEFHWRDPDPEVNAENWSRWSWVGYRTMLGATTTARHWRWTMPAGRWQCRTRERVLTSRSRYTPKFVNVLCLRIGPRRGRSRNDFNPRYWKEDFAGRTQGSCGRIVAATTGDATNRSVKRCWRS